MLTHAEVDADDPAFEKPTKPIGGQLTAEVARLRVAEKGWVVTEMGENTYRRVVASPIPKTIIESSQIRTLVDSGAVVIAAGGGGIPVVRDDGGLASGRRGHRQGSGIGAARRSDWGRHPRARHRGRRGIRGLRSNPPNAPLRTVGLDELRGHLAAGQFPAGSMGPKVASAIDFIEAGGARAIITSISKLPDALAGTAGTIVTKNG